MKKTIIVLVIAISLVSCTHNPELAIISAAKQERFTCTCKWRANGITQKDYYKIVISDSVNSETTCQSFSIPALHVIDSNNRDSTISYTSCNL